MNILFIVTWYTKHNAPMTAGLFHYEMAKAMQKYCNVAIYWPNDTSMDCNSFTKYIEDGIITYRRGCGIHPNNITKVSRSKRLLWRVYNKICNFRCVHKWQEDLTRIKDEFSPDLIHAHCGVLAGYVAAKCSNRVNNIPYIITEHTPIEMMRLKSFRIKNRWAYAYKHSKLNICVSDDLQRKLSGYFSKNNFSIIYNGVNDPLDLKLHTKINIYKNGYVNAMIVAAFYDKDVKGFQYLLPAVKALKSKGVKLYLHILGGGTYLDFYKSLACELEINDCITFYGQCDKKMVYEYASQMDFGVSASLFESAGVSVEEMQLLGKPVLVTKSGGANSLVRDFSSIVVDKGSVEALTIGLERMCSLFKMFDYEKIRKYAFENFEMDNICKKYVRIYTNII